MSKNIYEKSPEGFAVFVVENFYDFLTTTAKSLIGQTSRMEPHDVFYKFLEKKVIPVKNAKKLIIGYNKAEKKKAGNGKFFLKKCQKNQFLSDRETEQRKLGKRQEIANEQQKAARSVTKEHNEKEFLEFHLLKIDDEKDRRIIIMRYKGYESKGIAKALGMSVNAVNQRRNKIPKKYADVLKALPRLKRKD